ADAVPVGAQAEALAVVEDGSATYAVLPIDNSVNGVVVPTLDGLLERPGLAIVDSAVVPISFHAFTTDAAVERLTGPSRVWMDHPIRSGREVVATPAMPAFDGELVRQVIANEAFGQDDIPDLMYVTLKSTDLAGHLFGQESEESGAVLAEQDRQFEAIVKALEAKVGRENLVVALTADHGGAPLPELSGGKRLWEKDFLKALNAHFDKTPDGFPVAQYVSGTQIWIDHLQLKASKATLEDVKRFVAGYKVDGVPFFETAYTKDEIQAMRRTGVYGF
ncbi:MAG: alkaline phosphatase family protein, partial [Candidatus Sericytochromatia bacterium]